jgi:hypothetical protein
VLRRVFATFIAALAMLGALCVAVPAANASSAGSFVSKINAARRSAGRPALSYRSDLASVANRHSQRMASKNSLYHNPNLGGAVRNWRAVGENVGRGGDVASLHQAFMNSPSHRANILDRDFTEVGVGVVVDGNGIMWVTEVFRQPTRAPKARKPAPPRKPRVARKPSPRRKTTPKRPTRRTVAPRPKPVRTKPVPKPAPRAVDRSAVLRARLAALAAQPPAPVDGALPKALSYLEVMSALGR